MNLPDSYLAMGDRRNVITMTIYEYNRINDVNITEDDAVYYSCPCDGAMCSDCVARARQFGWIYKGVCPSCGAEHGVTSADGKDIACGCGVIVHICGGGTMASIITGITVVKPYVKSLYNVTENDTI